MTARPDHKTDPPTVPYGPSRCATARWCRPAALLVLLTPGLFLTPTSAHAAQWQLTYRVHVGGIAVLDAQADLSLSGDHYSVAVRAATEGFLARLFPWETRARSEGSVEGDRVLPLRHSQTSTLGGKPRDVRLTYDERGDVTAEVTPSPAEDGRDPVPDALRHGTVDPLSAVIGVLVAGMRGEGCAGSVPVFDGRRRYDMAFHDDGMSLVGASRYSVFAGAARQCRVTYTAIAGAKRDEGGSLWSGAAKADDRPPVELWLAPASIGGPPVPVRVETESGFGSVVIHLTGIGPVPQTAERPPNAPPPATP